MIQADAFTGSQNSLHCLLHNGTMGCERTGATPQASVAVFFNHDHARFYGPLGLAHLPHRPAHSAPALELLEQYLMLKYQ